MQTQLLIRTLLGFTFGILAANTALADHKHKHHYYDDKPETYYEESTYGDYGRVVSARPIYQSVAREVPQESCHTETVTRQSYRRNDDAFTNTLVGGLVGGAIGHHLGHGRGSATAVGGLIGATIGNDLSRDSRVVRYQDREVCGTHYRTEYESRIVGYDVSYRYQGRIYQTRTNRHPGDRIPVAVAVHSRYQD